jgi:Arc/MetJ family transcription regulator
VIAVTGCGRFNLHAWHRVEALIAASFDAIYVPAMDRNGRPSMRTTLALDDELVAKAQAFTGLKEKSALVREALTALIERESARRLARLGGSDPDATAAPRRRPE